MLMAGSSGALMRDPRADSGSPKEAGPDGAMPMAGSSSAASARRSAPPAVWGRADVVLLGLAVTVPALMEPGRRWLCGQDLFPFCGRSL